jgi:putative chitinase
MGGVFICYRRDDSRGSTRAIYERIVARFGRANVFFDVEDSKAGFRWKETLAARVSGCDALVAVIGRNWNPISAGDKHRLDDTEDQVRFELETAFKRGIPVFPVTVDGANLSNALQDLPDSLKQLSEWQSIDVSETRFDDDVARLTKSLPGLRENRKWKALAAVIVGLAALASVSVLEFDRIGGLLRHFLLAVDVVQNNPALDKKDQPPASSPNRATPPTSGHSEYVFKIDQDQFFSELRQKLFITLTDSQIDGIRSLIDEWSRYYSFADKRMLAYIIATVTWETGGTMQPIAEVGKGRGLPYGVPDPSTGQTYYGRGLLELTWKKNYQIIGDIIHVDLLNNPDLLLAQPYSSDAAIIGMMNGLFTGKSLSDYFSGNAEEWVNARRVVNGLDKAELIGERARKIFEIMKETKAQ